MTNILLFRQAEKTQKKGYVACLLFYSSPGLATGYFTLTSSSSNLCHLLLSGILWLPLLWTRMKLGSYTSCAFLSPMAHLLLA